MDDLDARLEGALAAWVLTHRADLEGRGVDVILDGPHDPQGMDPVYLLRFDGPKAESEAVLFRGGTLLLARVDKLSLALTQSHVDATDEEQITQALAQLANNV